MQIPHPYHLQHRTSNPQYFDMLELFPGEAIIWAPCESSAIAAFHDLIVLSRGRGLFDHEYVVVNKPSRLLQNRLRLSTFHGTRPVNGTQLKIYTKKE